MRLINADNLELFLKQVRRNIPKQSRDFLTRDMILNFEQYVHLQPTVDAVPVVRCKDCTHYSNTHGGNCDLWMIGNVEGIEFCSSGEKMEDK